MNNVSFFISHDVTGCWIFGKEYELFLDYENKDDFMIDRDDILLSAGASEKKKPLPILSALSKNFMGCFNEDPDLFNRDKEPDQNVVKNIFKQTIKDLNLDDSHSEEPEWVTPAPITNEDFLYRNSLNAEIIAFPITFEIMNLIGHSVLFHKGSRTMGSEFRELMTDYKDYALYLSKMRLPTYLMNQRIKQLTFRPVGLKCNEIDNGKIKHSFALNSNKAGILSLAWAELYFAQMYEMPFSTCTFCGQVYYLNRNLRQGSCGSNSCKKLLKKDRDQIRREKNPFDEQEKDRKRQQTYRDRKKTLELAAKGKTVDEIRNDINSRAKKRGDNSGIRSIDEIKKWIREMKKHGSF